MSRLGRLSLSPDPTSPPALAGLQQQYKSGLIYHQQERNSPSYQSYKQKNHDYVNAEYILHTGSLATRGQTTPTPNQLKGLVSKRSAAFEAFVQGTLQQNGSKTLPHNHVGGAPTPTLTNGHKSPFQIVNNGNSAFQHIKQKSVVPSPTPTANNFENYRQAKPASPFQSQRPPSTPLPAYQEPVKAILSNNQAQGYKSTIENKVKLLSQQNNPNQTYVSNMHVRVPSQESSIYSDTRAYINLGGPVAIASRSHGILMNPSASHLQMNNRGSRAPASSSAPKAPAIPKSQVVKKAIEPSYCSILQNQGEQNQAIYANLDFRSSDGSNTEEEVFYTSPPSPVSSSYSELRAAARGPLGAAFHHQMNPQALIYDPLYEPISGQSTISNQHKPTFGLGGLSSHYDDNFGPCSKCLQLIVGEGTGCSAMGRLYHIKCFTCHNCHCQLQGKPFYALDGKVTKSSGSC